jgi:glycosyltransferase involved in cell wall biosynthesis
VNRPRIFVIGPIPPPIHGQSIAFEQILKSEMSGDFEFFVFNKASLFSQVGDQGKFRIIKVLRDFKLALRLFLNVIWKSPSICYMTMAQSKSGIIRDSLIINICSKFSPVIIHLHGGAFRVQFEELNFIEKWFARLSLRQVVKVIVLSERFKSIFTNLVSPSKICVVQNGLPAFDTTDYSNVRPIRSGIKILFLSNLQPEKGLWDLLELFGRLQARKIPFTAMVAGPFPDDKIKNRALQLICKLNLEKNVEFPGVVTGATKASLFANADVFVFLPNQIEGQPLVIIEALMASLPIIATPQGGIVDLVIDGENGFIVPVHDIEAVINRIDILRKDPLLRIAMGEKSRQRFINEYTEEIYLTKIKKVLEEVLFASVPH